MIERKIIIGLITSTEFIQQIRNVFNVQLLESQMANRLAGWCLGYYDIYKEAPKQNIEGIYYQKLKEGLPKSIAEEIEQDILPALSEEYEQEKFNLNYLLDQTFAYFKEQHLKQHSDSIQALVDEGELLEAEQLACTFKPLADDSGIDLDLSNETALKRVEKAFAEAKTPIVRYPRQLGEFWNAQMVRGGFVALMGSDKRGKTFWLLDIAMRASRQKAKVAFFQAGDMTEDQQIIRIGVYLTKKSNLKKYSGKMYQPVRDCVWNQLDSCDREERECDFGIFKNRSDEALRNEITLDELIEKYKDNPDYHPCYNCKQYQSRQLGAVWIQTVDTGNPLTVDEAKEAFTAFFIKNKRQFKLSSHANGTLSVKQMKALLDVWEKQDDFVPDIVIVDYADLLVPEVRMEFRHQQDAIWKGLRNLSQERHCLVVTATQADAKGYVKNRLTIGDFSEDKRKNAHITAMWGLNQDPKGREKKLGIMRINEIVIREGDFSNLNEVTVLQNLRRGTPFLSSFW